MQELVSRIKAIHNSTNNISWGSCEYTPTMQIIGVKTDIECQCVVIVGHNVHRTIHTLFIEKFTDGVFRVSLVKDNRVGEIISIDNDRGVIICEIIARLKQWFPEIRR